MAESGNGGTTPTQPQKKELSTELRLLIAFLLMGVVMFVSPYFFKSTAPPPATNKSAPAAAPAGRRGSCSRGGQAASAGRPPRSRIRAERRLLLSRHGPLPHRLLQPRRGGHQLDVQAVQSEQRQAARTGQHRRQSGPALFLLLQESEASGGLEPGALQPRQDPDGLGITYEFSDGKVLARKSFRFEKRSYLAKVSSQVSENGKPYPGMDRMARRFRRPGCDEPDRPMRRRSITTIRAANW